MKFTFGIITSPDHHHDTNMDNTRRINLAIDSIEMLRIPEYEIIIIGSCNVKRKYTIKHDFDESIKSGWITKKKNLITKYSKYDNIVYLHDYVVFEPGWYNGFVKFGDEWDICMNVIKNADGTRFRDWINFEVDNIPNLRVLTFGKDLGIQDRYITPYLLEYNKGDSTKTYISGTYWIARKQIMVDEPLDENLVWGQPEDIEWSQRVRNKYKYVMNPYSAVKLLKYKDPVWRSIDPYHMTKEYINKELV